MTSHCWKWAAEELVRCALCDEFVNARSTGSPFPGSPHGPYATCEEYRASRRHAFTVRRRTSGTMWSYECVRCGTVLGYYANRLEEFQSRVHGECGDCDRVDVLAVRHVLEG